MSQSAGRQCPGHVYFSPRLSLTLRDTPDKSSKSQPKPNDSLVLHVTCRACLWIESSSKYVPQYAFSVSSAMLRGFPSKQHEKVLPLRRGGSNIPVLIVAYGSVDDPRRLHDLQLFSASQGSRLGKMQETGRIDDNTIGASVSSFHHNCSCIPSRCRCYRITQASCRFTVCTSRYLAMYKVLQ